MSQLWYVVCNWCFFQVICWCKLLLGLCVSCCWGSIFAHFISSPVYLLLTWILSLLMTECYVPNESMPSGFSPALVCVPLLAFIYFVPHDVCCLLFPSAFFELVASHCHFSVPSYLHVNNFVWVTVAQLLKCQCVFNITFNYHVFHLLHCRIY